MVGQILCANAEILGESPTGLDLRKLEKGFAPVFAVAQICYNNTWVLLECFLYTDERLSKILWRVRDRLLSRLDIVPVTIF